MCREGRCKIVTSSGTQGFSTSALLTIKARKLCFGIQLYRLRPALLASTHQIPVTAFYSFHPRCNNPNCLQMSSNVSWGAKSPLAEMYWFNLTHQLAIYLTTYILAKRSKTKGKNLRTGKKWVRDYANSSKDLLRALNVPCILSPVNLPKGECQSPGKSIVEHKKKR